MTTIISAIRPPAYFLWSLTVVLLLAPPAITYGAYVDDFTAVEDANDWPLQVVGTSDPVDSNNETLPGVWGGLRETHLQITSPSSILTVAVETSGDGYLNTSSGAQAISELTLGYGGAPIGDRDQPVIIDFLTIDYGSDPITEITNDSFPVTLTLSDGNALGILTMVMTGDNFSLGDPSEQLMFDLSDTAFDSIAFDGSTNISLSFLFELTEGLDFQIGSITLGTLDSPVNTIPEPSTWALGILALIGLALRTCRRRK